LPRRAEQFRALRQGDLFDPLCVADFMLDKDRIFAGLNLAGDELALYQQIYRHLAMEAPRPDLVVYLQAPVGVLLDRVQRRGIPYEQDMDPDYLERLGDAYTRYFHDYREAPLLIVNAAACNFADDDQDYNLLLDILRRPLRGRHYFNPGVVP
jgi:deoxyadenosine/deoxycytidine kinase